MKIFLPRSFRTVPWLNGGGTTHEITRQDEDGRMLWRLSIAEVTKDGPFSSFDGLTRILTMIEGAGLVLEAPGGPLRIRPGQPLRFSGSLPVTGRLEQGPVRNLNLIFDSSRIAASVTPLSGGVELTESAGPAGRVAILCLADPIQVAGSGLPRSAVAIGAGGHITLGGGARALLIRLDPTQATGR